MGYLFESSATNTGSEQQFMVFQEADGSIILYFLSTARTVIKKFCHQFTGNGIIRYHNRPNAVISGRRRSPNSALPSGNSNLERNGNIFRRAMSAIADTSVRRINGENFFFEHHKKQFGVHLLNGVKIVYNYRTPDESERCTEICTRQH
jgi:hypothetical protein